MNIFYLHHDPQTCASMHMDKHVVKMVLEYAQLLSTAHRVLDGFPTVVFTKTGRKQTRYVLPDNRDSFIYGATHIKHPSAIWVRQSDFNYRWLSEMLLALCDEYTYRYGKVHKVQRDHLSFHLQSLPMNIPMGDFTEPTPAMPDTYKVNGDSITSYRNYYNGGKQHLASWKKRPAPDWYKLQFV